MNYQEFKQAFSERISEKMDQMDSVRSYKILEDGYTSDNELELNSIRQTNIKYHNLESDTLKGDFVFIELSNGNLSRSSLEELYDHFCHASWESVWDGIARNIEYGTRVRTDVIDNIHDYDAICDKLIIRPINYTDNRIALKNIVHKQIGDIALVLYIIVLESDEAGLNTSKIQRNLLDQWEKTEDEVFNTALINTYQRAVPRVYNSASEANNPPYSRGAYMSLGYNKKLKQGLFSPLFTTLPSLNGAISFWYPGVKERIAEMAGGDYYVAFTGIHEFHVHPVGSERPINILRRIKDMNTRVNKPDEILSRKVYKYDHVAGKLEMVNL